MAGLPPCGREALALLNCVADKSYEESRCVTLLAVLRSCVERKNVKSFAIDGEQGENFSSGQAVEKVKS